MAVRSISPSPYQHSILSIPQECNLLLAGGRGGGKALLLTTPIPTPSGWTLLKDIQIGDKAFDEHGRPCTVTGVFDRMPEKAYRLGFNDGTHLDACDEHQWVTWTHAERKHYTRYDKSPKKGLPKDWANAPCRTTQQIVDTLKFGKRGDNNHCVPTTGPLQLPEADLPIDPYLLGVWLGDGTSCNRIGPLSKENTGAHGKYVWVRLLRDNGLLGNKHVPVSYMRASAAQRLSLLQGLMDTDGYACVDKKRVEFSTTSPLLAAAVIELARSLGEKPVSSKGIGMLYGKPCKPKWRITWRPKLPCFRVPRKLARISGACTQESRNLHRMIVSAEPIPPVPMRCLTVDSPNHMYLAGEGMIPTHNSFGLMFLMLRHVIEWGNLFGSEIHVLLVRETYQALEGLERQFYSLAWEATNGTVKYNKSEHTFFFPNGARVQFGQIAEEKDYKKYQGANITLLIVDEYGTISDTRWVTMLGSNLRGRPEIPLRKVWAANPGGPQHGFIYNNFIKKTAPWTEYTYDDMPWVICPSTYRDNPHINHAAYVKELRASCRRDDDLFRAWDIGDWDIARGAFFGGILDESVHKLTEERFPIRILSRNIWRPYLSLDWGSSAPSVCYVFAESPGINGFPKGSLILCDELHSCVDPINQPNEGLGWNPMKLVESIHDLRKPWGCPPEGVSDDSNGLEETLIERFEEYGLFVVKPTKDRISGWQGMKDMLIAAKERNGNPGLYIHQRCEYFWATVPYLERDIKRPEDIVTKKVPDHGADSCRYGIVYRGHSAVSGGIAGNY